MVLTCKSITYLGVGAKDQSKRLVAGSLRNDSQVSGRRVHGGGRAMFWSSGNSKLPTPFAASFLGMDMV